MTTGGKAFIIGITGASGASYGRRVVQALLQRGHEVHLIVEPW